MIALKLVFQSLAGLTAVGTVVAGGYKFMNNDLEQQFTYWIATAKNPSSTTTGSQTLFNNQIKNYECHLEQTTDSSCEIFLLNESATQTKEIDLKFLITEKEKIKTTHTFTENNHYILKVKNNIFTDLKDKTISIKYLGQDKKAFTDLTLKYIFEPNYKNIQSNIAIVQALTIDSTSSNTPTLTAETNYLCKLGDSTEVECKLKKMATDINISNFSTTTLGALTAPTAKKDIKQDHFYVLEFLTTSPFRKEWKKEIISISVKKPDNSKQLLGTFKFEQLLIGTTTTSQDLFFVKENHENFLVTTLAAESSSQPSTELITSETKKNYTCKWTSTGSSEVTDSSCQLYKLIFDSNKKSLSFPWQSSSETLVKTKTELKPNELFKLKVDGDKFKNFDSTTPITIELLGTSTSDAAKKYAKLTTKAHFSGNKLIGKTSLILGKASSSTTESTYKCKVADAKEDCDIYKFTTNPTTKDSLKFSESTKVTAPADIKTTDFYVLDLKTQTIDINSTLENIQLLKSTDSTKILDFVINTPLIGDITSTNKEVIVIK